MNQKLEIEYKTLLTQTHAANLLLLGLFSFSGKQTNTYYDTEDEFFQSQEIVLRIRKKDSKYLFTAKEKADVGLKETEFILDDSSISNSQVTSFLKQFNRKISLIPIGTSITYRYIFDDEFGQWCLDFNVFEFTSDVELEYELHQGFIDKREHFLDQLDSWNIPINPCESKFNRMKKQKQESA